MIQPPFLKPKDTIGIVSTARKITLTELQPALAEIESWGFKVEVASNIGKEMHQMAGTDEERTAAMQSFLDNAHIKAIICARGGYGTVKILERLDWKKFNQNPKWICGYSDVTALHNTLQQMGFMSLHSTMPINFLNNTPAALQSLNNTLLGNLISLKAKSHPLNRRGQSSGVLVGGNLSMLYSMLGSNAQLSTQGKLLFIEDLDEYLYHIDRIMMALKRADMLANLAGLVVGGMTDMNDNAIPFGKTAVEIIKASVAEYGFPVGFNFPAGHVDNNQTLIFGKKYNFSVSENGSELNF